MNDREQKNSDLEEADKLDAAAMSLTGPAREEVESEAAALRARWQAAPHRVALAAASADGREADLAEADRLSAVAVTLRAGGAGRAAVEADAAALRAKWPDFTDDCDGQVQRLASHLLAHGFPDILSQVPARVAVQQLIELEGIAAEVESLREIVAAAGGPCAACGLPRPEVGPGPVNSFVLEAVRRFESDSDFRTQVLSGSVKSGQLTHPWIPGAVPHKGPGEGVSPWAMPGLANAIRNDARVAAEVGPQLRAALAARGLALPDAKQSVKSLALATRPN